MKEVELLAPAKDLETGICAINSGADAVYIGADNFGARVNAANSLDDIKKLVEYAHKFFVKIHVTINTIMSDSELEDAVKLINKLYEIGVDAIIVQDMGILQKAIEGKLAPIQLHMSTQCDNRSLEKAKFFDNVGASRVILARELSLNQIKNICKNTECEVETFIHGALCVSYSGQCYMSFANGGRSANRGKCAQPCRKKYSLIDEDGKILLKDKYLLSLKDFNASPHIKELLDAGVNSFKIEGRLKDNNYVKNVVLFYNNLLKRYSKRTSSGKVFCDFTADINKTFNRQYTDYFLVLRNKCYNFLTPKSMGECIGKVTKVNKNSIEVKTDKKLNPQDGICYAGLDGLDGFKINRTEGNLIYPNKMPKISIGTVLYRNYDFEYSKLLDKSAPIRKIGVNIEIHSDKIIATDEDNITVSVKIDSSEQSKNPQNMLNSYIKQFSKTGDSDFYILNIFSSTDPVPFLPVSKVNELRRNLLQKLTHERLNRYQRKIQKSLSYAKFPYSSSDYRANVMNTSALKFYENCGCKISEPALEKSGNIHTGAELMRCKHCLRYSANICSKKVYYNKRLFLVDENGKKYPLRFDCKNCEMVVLNGLK